MTMHKSEELISKVMRLKPSSMTIGSLSPFDMSTDADSLVLLACEMIENSLNLSDDVWDIQAKRLLREIATKLSAKGNATVGELMRLATEAPEDELLPFLGLENRPDNSRSIAAARSILADRFYRFNQCGKTEVKPAPKPKIRRRNRPRT
ncbi:hypothetical protein WAQ86_004739 [Salmonella enterica]